MKRNEKRKKDSKITEAKLNNTANFFAAYGTFLTGVFCILQYFGRNNKMLNIVTMIGALLILLVTYFLTRSNWCVKFTGIWNYVKLCADVISIINPIMLAISISLAVSPVLELLLVCLGLEIAHLFVYILAIGKHKRNLENSGC